MWSWDHPAAAPRSTTGHGGRLVVVSGRTGRRRCRHDRTCAAPARWRRRTPCHRRSMLLRQNRAEALLHKADAVGLRYPARTRPRRMPPTNGESPRSRGMRGPFVSWGRPLPFPDGLVSEATVGPVRPAFRTSHDWPHWTGPRHLRLVWRSVRVNRHPLRSRRPVVQAMRPRRRVLRHDQPGRDLGPSRSATRSCDPSTLEETSWMRSRTASPAASRPCAARTDKGDVRQGHG